MALQKDIMTYNLLLLVISCTLIQSDYSLYDTDIRQASYPTFDCLYAYLIDAGKENGGRYIRNSHLIPYCRRPDNDEQLIAPTENFNNENIEKIMTFDQLKRQNITSEQLLAWFAPIDIAESYEMNNHQSNNFYKCKSPWFGPMCQYKFSHDQTLSFTDLVQAISKHYSFIYSEDMTGSCYRFLDSSNNATWPECLDWREICDGKFDYINGEDEQGCEVLENHKCDNNEYRCHYGGQCIPQDFEKDSRLSVDCLDGSDEHEYLPQFGTIFNGYCTDVPTFRCQERKSRYPLSFQCGDGQYVMHFGLPDFGTICTNQRDLKLSRIMLTTLNHITDTNCREAFICALYSEPIYIPDLNVSGNIITPAPIIQHLCQKTTELLSQYCSMEWIAVPERPILFGFFQFVYLTNRSINEFQLNAAPEFVCFHGTKCPVLLANITPISIIDGVTCCHISDLMGYIESLGFHSLLQRFPDLSRQCWKKGTEKSCSNSSYFHCNQSLKCIPYNRVGDGYMDCYYGEDEEYDTCHRNDLNRFTCQSDPKKCLLPVAIGNGINDCSFKEDEDFQYTSNIEKLVPFGILCDGYASYEPTSPISTETDETNCELWPCDNPYTHCDGFRHCMNAIDELNCPDSRCSYNEHECLDLFFGNLICIPHAHLFDKYIDDCNHSFDIRRSFFYNGTENISKDYISWNQSKCLIFNEFCIDRAYPSASMLKSDVCFHECGTNSLKCPNTVHLLETTELICYFNQIFKIDGRTTIFLKSTRFGYWPPVKTYHTVPTTLKHNRESEINPTIDLSLVLYCNRGIAVLHGFNQTIVCLCPPNYFGDRCEWQNQRVSLTLQLFSRNFTSNHVALQAIIMLIDENGHIAPNHERITYVPSRDCNTKYNLYLLYPNRPKNLSQTYSIRIDIFDKTNLNYWDSWYLPILFPFLPVNRIATQLFIGGEQQIISCPLSCGEHGRCRRYINKNSSYFCQCDQGYSGIRCEISHPCHCAKDSWCLAPSICVCPLNKFGPHCYLKYSICESNNNPCQHNGICVPSDDRINLNGFFCICSSDYSGSRCENVNNRIDLHLNDRELIQNRFLLVHFITVFKNADHQRTTILKKMPYNAPILTFPVSQPFHIVFVQIPRKSYYLAILRETYIPSEFIFTEIQSHQRCISIEHLLNSTFVNAGYLNRTKYYPYICRENLEILCLYDQELMCICDLDRFSNCFSFNHTMNYDCEGYNYCENAGQCFQNNETCPTKFTCVCPDCYYGAKCQFSTKGFLFSLDPILVYLIKRHVSINEQPLIIKISIMFSTIIFLLGIVNGLLSIIVFSRKKPRQAGSGYYLLFSSIISICMILMLTIKFWQLVLSQMHVITNRSFIYFNCMTMDFLLRILLSASEWLNASVAIERMISVMNGTNFTKQKSINLSKWVIPAIIFISTITQIHDPIHRQLIDDEDEDETRTLCLVEYSSSVRMYNIFITLFHFLMPFSINVITALLMIKKISHRRVNIFPHESYNFHFRHQIHRYQHLLYAPCLLIILSLPRLIISFSKQCMKSAREPWFYLIGYFVSFVPSTLTFIVFVLPSANYKNELRLVYRRTIRRFRRNV